MSQFNNDVNSEWRWSRKSAARSARKKSQHGLVKLSTFEPSDSKFLGRNKTGAQFEEQLKNSMSRYKALRDKRANLFAFVMPCGHGKSYLAKKYGFVDVDELVTRNEHNNYVTERNAALNGFTTWGGHNTKWYSRLNSTLDYLDYSMPVIIFVQTEELALEIGAVPVGFLKLKKAAFERNIAKRDPTEKHFSAINYNVSVPSKMMPNYVVCNSNDELEATMLKILNLSDIPVACPHKYSSEVWNNSYQRTVPGWILRGERAGERTTDVNELRVLYERGLVPKECVDYYARHSYVPTQFDFGITMYEWSCLLAVLPTIRGDRKEFDTVGDMVTIFPPRSAKELQRANVTMRHLVTTFNIFAHDDAYEIASHHVGSPHVFVTSILSAWKGIAQQTSVAELVFPWFKTHFTYWANTMKSLHSYIRTSRFIMNTEISEEDRQALMYMDLLVGRSEYTIDEMAEVELRHSDTYDTKHLSYDPHMKVYTNAQYKKDFLVAMNEAHMRIKTDPKPINLASFGEFYRRRHSWLTKGGLVSNTLPKGMKEFSSSIFDSVNELVEEIRGRHNKKSLFEMNELYDIICGVNGGNFNITKTMIKYEVGKKDRTLLPGSLAHFIVFSYVLLLAEKQNQIGSVRLNAAKDADIQYFDRKMSAGVYHVLYDWADFNEQHSAWEMAEVIRHLSTHMPQGGDYAMFCEALVRGMYTMGLEDREGHIHKIWRGLYSGWRGTTWINTVLNFCYVHIALVNLERLSGQSVVLMVDHGGDDLDLMLSQPSVQPVFMEIMDDMLFKANKWKQMFGLRSEFFRNTISGARVYASPTRGLASFVAGDWEGAGRATVRERVISLLDQIGKLRRRGVYEPMCQGFTMCTISHWCKVKENEEWVNLPGVIIHGHPDNNGLGVPDENNQVWLLDRNVPEINEEWYRVVVPDHKASSDYVKVLSEELEKFSLVIERQNELAKKLAEDSYDIEKTMDRVAWKAMLTFSANVTRKVDAVKPAINEEVFQSFLAFNITPEIERKFDKASRYQEYIGYITLNGVGMTKEKMVELMSDGEVSVEAIEFQGDMYYQRLVPEFIGNRASMFCRVGLNAGILDTEKADAVFKIICWMASQSFRHMM